MQLEVCLTSAMRQPSRHLAVLLSASASRADSSGGLLVSCISSEIKLHIRETRHMPMLGAHVKSGHYYL